MAEMFKAIIKTLGLVKDFADARRWLGKRWFLSKVLWVNAIAVLALWLQLKLGFVIDAEEQVAIVAVINIILRFATKQPLVMRESDIIEIKTKEDCENDRISG